MGVDLDEACPMARELFDRAESLTGLPLRRLCAEGPEDQLSRTDIAQPAIFTVSAAVLAAMQTALGEDAPRPTVTAGLSLGEYTALYAAGAMDFETAVKLVARRGELMQQTATAVPSGMVIVLGMDETQAQQLCNAAAEGEVLTCANFNCPGQIVLSGQAGACARALAMAETFGASGANELNVAGGFHGELMAPAAEAFGAALAEIAFAEPAMPVISNVDGACYTHADEIPQKLLAQLTHPVRWQQSMEALLAQGSVDAYEIGPGRVLGGLMRRIDRKQNVISLSTVQAVEDLKVQVST